MIDRNRCTAPGCREPRHVSRSGKVYTKCDLHYRQEYQAKYRAERPTATPRPPQHPSAVGRHVRVKIIDWTTERIWTVEAVVCDDEPLPRTEGELKKLLAEAAQAGFYVAKPQPFKEEMRT